MSKKKSSTISTDLNLDKLNFFYGIPHCHTNISTGKATPSECIDLSLKSNLDFLILTDHNSYFQNNSEKWNTLLKIINKTNKKLSNLIIIQGFEVQTSWGHLNIINPPNYFLGTLTNIYSLILWCLKDKDTLVSINHPNSDILKLPHDDLINQFISNVEVGNGIYDKKYSKHSKVFFQLLDKGWKLSAINGQDNHKLNIGREENLTCVVSYNLSNESLIEGFRHHRTFSTESKSLKMYFTINNFFMGDTATFNNDENLSFYIFAFDSLRKISKIQIISSNNTIVKELLNLDLHTVRFMYEHKLNTCEKWYVIKIILSDGREGLSSPIFINLEL
ncbi:MAG: CehA/McbA family metallohydrolase [Sarcina sp.]